MARVPIALPACLTLALERFLGEAECLEGGCVQEELMARAVPDNNRPGVAEGVQFLARDGTVPELMVSPGEEKLLGVRKGGVGLA